MTPTRLALSLLVGIFAGQSFGKNPVLFVPGWGPPAFTEMKRLIRYFRGDGYAAADLHPFTYPYKESLSTIRKAMIPQLKAVIEKYPPGTRFDVVTHSLGHFVAMESLLEGGWGASVDHYIGLAGIGMGQYDLPNGCGLASCTAIEPLTPFPSPYATQLLTHHAAAFAAWKKCSLYSQDDNVLDNPYFASHFTDGTNVEVKGYRHNDFLRSQTLYRLMHKRCGLNP